MKEKKKQLTKAETQVMNILWSLPEQQGFIQDIIDRYPEPTSLIAILNQNLPTRLS